MKSPFSIILLAISLFFLSFDSAICKYTSSNHITSNGSISSLEAYEKELASSENKISNTTPVFFELKEHSFSQSLDCSGYCHNHCHCKHISQKPSSLQPPNSNLCGAELRFIYFRIISSEVFRPPIA